MSVKMINDINKKSIENFESNSAKYDVRGEQAAKLILTAAGEDLSREGLARTPARFSKALAEMTSGYKLTAADAVGEGIFKSESKGLVSVCGIEFYSQCEHHLLPFWGSISVAYYPDEKILGLSKIPRLVDVFAKRFQVQERITKEIADAIMNVIAPRAVFVRVEAVHLCMMMRGVEKQHSVTVSEYSADDGNLSDREFMRGWAVLRDIEESAD